MKLFAEITKVDAAKRMVFGYASTEALDSQGEIVKIDAIEAALPDYMKFANIREMHTASAVGIAKEASVDDKGLYLAVKVVDESAWQKVVEGVYKGFSIGGRATKRDALDKSVITGLKLTEISLVDRPANPEATFDVFKADGADDSDDIIVDEPAAEVVAEVVAAEELHEAAAEKADGVDDIAKADDENVEQLSAVDTLADMLTKGTITPERVVELVTRDTEVKKGMYHVAQLAVLLKELGYMVTDQAYEALNEGDASTVPAQLKAWLTAGVAVLNAMVDEETGELIAGSGVDYEGNAILPDVEIIEQSDKPTDVQKAGKRNSKADQDVVQAMHDHACTLGANCAAGAESTDDESGNSKKADDIGDLTKLDDQAQTIIKGLGLAPDALAADVIGKMAERITTLEAQPTVGKALLRAIAKGDDVVVIDGLNKAEAEPEFSSGEDKAKWQLMKMYGQGRAA